MSEELLKKYVKVQEDLNRYNLITQENVQSINSEIAKVEKERGEVDETIETLNTLFEHARLQSFVKLSPLCYVPATIKHTGEYNVFFSPTYQSTLTHKQTIDYLKRKHSDLNSSIELYNKQLEQLDERINFEQSLAMSETGDMPEVIKSDRGVAVKKGMFYEIIEEDDNESAPIKGKRISRIKQ